MKIVATELLKQQATTLMSAYSFHEHFEDALDAERAYHRLTIGERSKFVHEGTDLYQTSGLYDSWGATAQRRKIAKKAPENTMAVVSIIMAIQGDQTKVATPMNSRQDVVDALTMIANHSSVDDCLQSVEILWTPDDPTVRLTNHDLVADYPDLRIV